jgi:hypothetical protein
MFKSIVCLSLIANLTGSLCLATETGKEAAENMTRPMLFGVDTAGAYHWDAQGIPPWSVEAFWQAIDDLGADFVNFHSIAITHAGDKNNDLMKAHFKERDDAVRTHGKKYTISLEDPNFRSVAEITSGTNEYEHSGDRHFWLLRMDWLRSLLAPAIPDPCLLRVIYDEADHMQLSNNKYSNFPHDTFDKPFFVDTTGMPLAEAYDRLVAECRRIRTEHYENLIPLNTEQCWPDLYHIFARAGWTVAPKFLKEHFSPVVAAIALGAAVQYQNEGGGYWVCADLWGVRGYPGHTPEALCSALLLAYWTGAETTYIENVDYRGGQGAGPAGAVAEAEPGGSLIAWSDRDNYHLTRYGQVTREFAKEYLPTHPRTIDWKQYRPRVAIIRLPDGGWGQYDAGSDVFPHPEAPSRNRLLGNRAMPLDESAREWLQVWAILTHGVTKPGAINYNNPMVYPTQQDFFVPLDRVAVFDHEVKGTILDNVECFVVCGHALSQATFDSIRERVAKGAVCLIARRLYDLYAKGESLPGVWSVVDHFDDPQVEVVLKPFLGPADMARYDFGDQVVEVTRGSVPDSIEVQVLPGESKVKPASEVKE